MKKVSVCIPAYNNEISVKRLLASIEEQDYTDYEVIITDDSDGNAIERLAEEKEYVRYYKNEKRLGATANWNEAIKKSTGEYIKIMHHDDWFTHKSSLRRFVELLEKNPRSDMVFSGSRQVEGDKSFDRWIADGDVQLIREDYRNLFLGNTIGAPSAVMVRRCAVFPEETQKEVPGAGEQTVYDEKLTWLVDMEYYMQLLKKNPQFVYTKEPLISIGISGGQLTEECRDNRELNVKEYGYIYRKYELGTEKRFREKLIKVCAEAGKSPEEAEGFGIKKEEYQKELRRKLWSKIQWKLTHSVNRKSFFLFFLVLAVLCLIPILGLSSFNYATGDDLGYGSLTHQAWLATHSLTAVLKAAGETVEQYYLGWQGTWLSIFLFALQPEVFSPGAYILVPGLMLFIWMGATGLLLYRILVKEAGMDKWFAGILYLLFTLSVIQYVPSTKSAIFWYNGTTHYVIPYAIALLAIYFYIGFISTESKKGKQNIAAYVGLTVSLALLGGGNYQAALLAPMVIILLSLCHVTDKDKEKRKRIYLCLFPLLLETVGLVISMLSPGNKSRGGAEWGFHMEWVVNTVLSCFVRGGIQAVTYVSTHPLLVLFFAVAAVTAWMALENCEKKRSYPLAGLFVGLSYCVYCAMFAPEIYAGVEVSGGVYNMNYYIFLFMIFGDMIYVEGALIYHRNQRRETAAEKNRHKFRKAYLPVAVLAGLVYLCLCRRDIKTMTTYQCIDYIRSGQAADFKEQMEYQRAVLLDDGIKDAVLPAINDKQGPLMYMPLTEEKEAWTNTVTSRFYGKNSVIAIPREEWNSRQEAGDPVKDERYE